MPVPSSIADLSQTAGSNYPAGSESPSTIDDYLRTHASFIAQLRSGKGVSAEAELASAATVDIGAANSQFIKITGTTTITSLGTNYSGPRFIRFTGSLTLTHNATTLILPGGANFTVQDGMTCIAVPNGNPANGWRIFALAPHASIVSVKQYGASSANTNAQNKTALQAAITAVGVAGGGQIIVDYGINYGLKTRTPSTWPDFSGITSPIIIIDCSTGDTQSPTVYPAGYDGAMYRVWTHTPQTTTPGQHDGNTHWLRASWAPAYCISNDSNLAAVGDPSRTASDNRRAYFATMVDGECSWQFGNGNLAGAGYTDEELSNFAIQKFSITGDTLGNYAPYQVQRKTGNVSYCGGRSIPAAHHHFEAVTGSPTLNIGMFESKSTTAAVTLRNSNGSGDDVEIKNVGGDLRLNIPAQGDALIVNKSNRYIGIGVSATYPLHLEKSASGDYVAKFYNTNATNGYGPVIWSAAAAGSGFSLLEAYSNAGADIKFRLRGDGYGYCDGAWTGGGADYAEYFEWADGNPDNEDRRGFSVALVGNKIKKAEAGDKVIGVISGNPSVVGDAAWNSWTEKYLRDDFGTYLLEDDPENPGGKRRVLNPAYNPDAEYTPREQRKEWACVGLVGKLRVRKGQPVADGWIKMRDVSASVEEWLVK